MSFVKIVICIPALNILIYGSNLMLNRMNKIKRPAVFAETDKEFSTESFGVIVL